MKMKIMEWILNTKKGNTKMKMIKWKECMSKIKEINDYLDYCIEHESNASDNETSIKAESYSRVIHEMYGKTKKILDEFLEIRGKSNV